MSFDLKGRAHTKGASSFRSASRHSRHEDEKVVVELGALAGSAAPAQPPRKSSAPLSAIKMLLYAAATGNEEMVTRALKSGAHINDVDSGPDESDFAQDSQQQSDEKKDSKAREDKSDDKENQKENEEKENTNEEKKDDESLEEKKASVYKNYVYTGDAAVHRAAAAGHAAMIKFLWINNADLEVKNRIGSSALHRAVSNNQLEAVVQLLDLQARVDAVNNIGNTPLHCAVYNGNVDIARLLVDGGAWTTLNTPNKANMTPLHYARKRPMIQLLEQYLKQYHLAAASFSRLPTHLLKDLHGILPSSSFHAAQSFKKPKVSSAVSSSAGALPPSHPQTASSSSVEEKSSSAASGAGITNSFSKHKKKVTLAVETIIKEEDEDNAANAV